MATNELYETGYQISVVCSYPTTPASGGVVIYGDLTGVAEADEGTDGKTPVDFGPGIWDLSVTDINTGGIAVGAPLFASKASPVVLSNLSTGVFFGYAMEVVSSGQTATIPVMHVAQAGGVLGSGTIGTAQLAANAVVKSKVSYETATLAFGASDTEKTATVTTGSIIIGWHISDTSSTPTAAHLKLGVSSTTLTGTLSAAPGGTATLTVTVVLLKAT